ncbi:MAG TPA: hypothetical protein PLZ77_01720 [Lachnospiraceae bacterium]|nr:hypothetical protein [Lachnospiraceae bacterium]HPF28804.1 hypothetical protein [Lachnospiraceae bacterium]
MNVSQLAGSVYSNAGLNVNDIISPKANSKGIDAATESESSSEFSKILSAAVTQDSSSVTADELLEAIDSTENNSQIEQSADVMDILTDSERAKEYLSSQSGRQVIVEMAKNSIAGIVSGIDS